MIIITDPKVRETEGLSQTRGFINALLDLSIQGFEVYKALYKASQTLPIIQQQDLKTDLNKETFDQAFQELTDKRYIVYDEWKEQDIIIYAFAYDGVGTRARDNLFLIYTYDQEKKDNEETYHIHNPNHEHDYTIKFINTEQGKLKIDAEFNSEFES
jgi:hypothetical protein